MTDLFAWGCETYDEHSCPARQAGFSMDTWTARKVAERYDTFASHYALEISQDPLRDEGSIRPEDAKLAWSEAIEQIADRIDRHYDDVELLHFAARVQRELGWDE